MTPQDREAIEQAIAELESAKVNESPEKRAEIDLLIETLRHKV